MNPWLAIPTFTATVAWLSVVIWYWIRAKWWKSYVGQNTMGISMFIALALVRLSYTHLDGIPASYQPFWVTAFGVFIYSGLTYFGFQRLVLIEQSQRMLKLQYVGDHPYRRWDDPK